MSDVKERHEAAKTVEEALKGIHDLPNREGDRKAPREDAAAQRFIDFYNQAKRRSDELRDALETLAVELEIERGTGFGRFIATIGESVVDAQRSLDSESQRYLAETAGRSEVLPSVFRIPRVRADIKFALRETRQRGVNVVLFQSRTGAETMHQQSLKFDIVSIPPPPELGPALRAGKIVLPHIEFVLSSVERERIREVLRRVESAPSKISNMLQDVHFDRVLFLRAGPFGEPEAGEPSPEQFLVVYVDRAAKMGIWQLTLGTPPRLQTVVEFGGELQPGTDSAVLKRFIGHLCDAQEQVLEGL